MRVVRRIGLAICLAVIALSGLAGAAETPWADPDIGYDPDAPERRGQAGMTFLQIGGSARQEAMGGSGAGTSSDLAMAFYNVAGTAEIGKLSAYFNRVDWLADMAVNHAAVGGQIGPVVAGLTLTTMDYGDIVFTVYDPQAIGTGYTVITGDSVCTKAWAVGAFVSAKMTDRFSFGAAIKYNVQDFGTNTLFTYVASPWHYMTGKTNDNRVGIWSVDIGTQYNTGFRGLRVNMGLQNFASAAKYVETGFDLPMTYRVGLSIDAIEAITGEESDFHKLAVYFDGVDRRDVPIDFATGGEYQMFLGESLSLALRFGRRAAMHQDGWLSAGGGIGFEMAGNQVFFDYAYKDYGPGLTSQQMSLRFNMR